MLEAWGAQVLALQLGQVGTLKFYAFLLWYLSDSVCTVFHFLLFGCADILEELSVCHGPLFSHLHFLFKVWDAKQFCFLSLWCWHWLLLISRAWPLLKSIWLLITCFLRGKNSLRNYDCDIYFLWKNSNLISKESQQQRARCFQCDLALGGCEQCGESAGWHTMSSMSLSLCFLLKSVQYQRSVCPSSQPMASCNVNSFPVVLLHSFLSFNNRTK